MEEKARHPAFWLPKLAQARKHCHSTSAKVAEALANAAEVCIQESHQNMHPQIPLKPRPRKLPKYAPVNAHNRL